MHPVVLSVLLAGTVLWGWSILTPVTSGDWILWAAIGISLTLAVAIWESR